MRMYKRLFKRTFKRNVLKQTVPISFVKKYPDIVRTMLLSEPLLLTNDDGSYDADEEDGSLNPDRVFKDLEDFERKLKDLLL